MISGALALRTPRADVHTSLAPLPHSYWVDRTERRRAVFVNVHTRVGMFIYICIAYDWEYGKKKRVGCEERGLGVCVSKSWGEISAQQVHPGL